VRRAPGPKGTPHGLLTRLATKPDEKCRFRSQEVFHPIEDFRLQGCHYYRAISCRPCENRTAVERTDGVALFASGIVLFSRRVPFNRMVATIALTSMDGKPWPGRTRCASTRVRAWPTAAKNGTAPTAGWAAADRATVPTSIEPVTVTVKLRSIEGARSVSAAALDGSGKPIGDPIVAKKTAAGWRSQWELPPQHGTCCQ